MLQIGIVGLPNVGKSTLFNALVGAHRAAVERYPFCTIDPNVGVVEVPDRRLDELAQVVNVERRVPGVIEFVDIAGLIEGASRGEGLGNRFLAHIREVDALVHVVRCFEDAEVPHVPGVIDPVRDVRIVLSELILADLESAERQLEKARKEARRGSKQLFRIVGLLEQAVGLFQEGRPAWTFGLRGEDAELARHFFFLTSKPQLLVANVSEKDLPTADKLPAVHALVELAKTHQMPLVILSAQLEEQLIDLPPEEARAYLAELGIKQRGTTQLIQQAARLLGLITFFTFNQQEVRAWLIPAGTRVAKAAGRIHTDMEEGFIRAEVVPWQALVQSGSVSAARQAGHYRVEGKDYVVQDGDVVFIHFRD